MQGKNKKSFSRPCFAADIERTAIRTKISVCVDALYGGREFCQSLREISEAGARAYEFWSWWDKDLGEIKQAAQELGLTAAAFCTRFVSLVDPGRRPEYLKGLEESVVAAEYLGCGTLITQVGNDTGYGRERQRRSLVDGLKAAAPMLERAGITLAVEPLNTHVDHAGYFLSDSPEAFDIIGEVGSPNVKLLFDIYHQQITEGNIVGNITANIDKICHLHAAGVPGRHELANGELNYRYIFDAAEKAGYRGYAGLEYFPLGEPAKGIRKWL